MANSTVYYVGTTSSLGTTLNDVIGNTNYGSSTTGALVANTYYAYIDGYTSNINGSQQGTGNGYLVRVVFRFASPNTTKRTVKLYVAAYFGRRDYVGSNNMLHLTMVANGDTATYAQMTNIPYYSWTTTLKMSTTLNYNKNGNATTTVQLTGYNETGSCRDITCQFQIQAPRIEADARTATLTLSSSKATLGSTTLTLTHSQVTNIKTNLSISFKDASGQSTAYSANIATGNTTKALTYKPAIGIADSLTTRTSVSASIKCVTYKSNGTTKIGEKSYPVTLQVPDNVKHNITAVSVTDSTGSVPSGGYKIGVHKPRVQITIDSSNAHSSTIDKVEVNFGTETLTYTRSAANIPALSSGVMYVTSTKVLASSSQVFTVIITDSRGRVSSKTASVSATALETKPAITYLSVGRTTASSGTPSDSNDSNQGANCRVKYTVTSSRIKSEISAGSISNGSVVIQVQYKKVNGTFTTYSTNTYTTTTGVITGDFIIPINDTENAYVIRITADDGYGNIYREMNLSSGFVLMEFNESGKGMSIGETASESESLLIGMITKFRNTVYNSAGSVALTSDERRKNTINPLSNIITEDVLVSLFKSLDPISFKYNEQKNDLLHFGFSANKFKEILDSNDIDTTKLSIVEEVEDVLINPETKKEYRDKFLTLRYEEIIPILFMIIKILLKELSNINTRVEHLEDEINNGKDS